MTQDPGDASPARSGETLDAKLLEFAASLPAEDRVELERRLGLSRLGRPRAGSTALVERPRLLRQLAARFETRLTFVCAGAGFGKSTLLRQARAAAAADPTTVDLVVELRTTDSVERVVDTVLDQLGVTGTSARTAGRLADAIWARAPQRVCVVLDDLHRLSDREAARLVGGLLEELPTNGHVLVASRHRLRMPLERLRVGNQVVDIGEDELGFTDDELAEFAELHGTHPNALAPGVRWPALLALGRVGRGHPDRYLEEEILALLPPERRVALTQLGVVRWFDDDLVQALTDFPGTAAALVDDLPLVGRLPDERIALHDIWRELLDRDLTPEQRRRHGAAAAARLLARHRHQDAFETALTVGDDEGALRAARACALALESTPATTALRRVLGIVPDHLSTSLEVDALRGALYFATDPVRARPALLATVQRARRDADVGVELSAMLRLAELYFRTTGIDDLAVLLDRLEELARQGSRQAMAARALVRAWQALLCRDYDDAATLLADPAIYELPSIVELVEYYRMCWWGWVGDARHALLLLEAGEQDPKSRHLRRSRIYRCLLRWHLGELDADGRFELRSVLNETAEVGERHLTVEASCTVALFHASAGELEPASELVRSAAAHATPLEDGNWGRVALAQAEAVLALFDGDEARSADLLRASLPHHGPPLAGVAHVYTNVIALAYALVPETRPLWDAVDLGPDMAFGRQVGRAIVAVRSDDLRPAAELPWDQLGRLRTWAYEPHLAELAVAALAAGNELARPALETLRVSPHGNLERLGHHPSEALAAIANQLIGVSSRRPAGPLTISVLGPLTVHRGDVQVLDKALRRRRLRQLLGVIIHHRRISRRAAAALIWPDMSDSAAANNLRVALTQLHRVLEPERTAKTKPWYVRAIGDDLVFVGGDGITVDVDEFEREIERGRSAERAGRAADALEAYLRACRWYRGDYLDDASPDELGYLDRLRRRTLFAEVATRSAELLVAAARAPEARDLALRAIDAEPFLDGAHLALARSFLLEDRTATARSVLDRYLVLLENEGLSPTNDARSLASALTPGAQGGRSSPR